MIWPRFGPYHLARLRAAHALLAARGDRLTAVEVTTRGEEYAWALETAPEPFARACALPGRTFEDVPPAEMQQAVADLLDRLNPDAVAITSYSTPDAQAAVSWCRRRRRAAILMLASKADDVERTLWRERLKSILVRSYDAALVGGTPQRAYLHDLGFPAARVFETYNAVDNAFFAQRATAARQDRSATARRLGLSFEGPYFLTVCRLLALKNIDGLLRAYASYAAAAGRPWPLVIVGDGPERERLERLTADLGLDTVHFAGFRQKEDLPSYYALAGALVLPSFRDTWGLVVNEAMAAGLPVLVSTQAGCSVDLVDPGVNGFTFDPHDGAQMASMLSRIADMDIGRMGLRSAQIIENWSPEAFATGLYEAAQAALSVSDRSFPLASRLILATLKVVTRKHGAFHTAPNL